jgi:LemA protein
MAILWTLVGLGAIALLWGIAVYNGLVRRTNLTKEGWSGIDAQLKRRADLVPNVVAVVKGYAAHESSTLEEVTALRSKSLGARNVPEREGTEAALTGAITRIMALAESYPQLKANENFLQLQTQLAAVEDDIQLARRYYNGTVRDLNILIQSFPASLVAGALGFHPGVYFQLESDSDRQTPAVSFDRKA